MNLNIIIQLLYLKNQSVIYVKKKLLRHILIVIFATFICVSYVEFENIFHYNYRKLK